MFLPVMLKLVFANQEPVWIMELEAVPNIQTPTMTGMEEFAWIIGIGGFATIIVI